MSKISLILNILLICVVYSCNYFSNKTNYKVIKIGDQIWMKENLIEDKFRNGDLIPEAKTEGEWIAAAENEQPAWCYYDNDPINGDKYGKLYNWFAVNDPRGLAPSGWHVPSYYEWYQLNNYLGKSDAGVKMKSNTGWLKKGNGTNESGFSGLPGGYRKYERNLSGYSHGFFDIGNDGYWWSSTENFEGYPGSASYLGLNYRFTQVADCNGIKFFGMSVRCVKNTKNEVTIGNQVWMNKNLNVNKFQNGDLIPEANSTEKWNFAATNKQPAWCYYNKSSKYGKKYGKLYNWFAVNDSRGLAPLGWQVPSDKDWKKLIQNLGVSMAGSKIKSTNGWLKDGNGTNESGFSGLPGGVVDFYGVYFNIGEYATWWSSSEDGSNDAWFYGVSNIYDNMSRQGCSMRIGQSVRCIRY